ncbi:MAG: FtsX-like permease family protein, partial [Bryobacteraceae bacterium]
IRIDKKKYEVVGVTKAAKMRELTESPAPYVFLPFVQGYQSRMTLHVETQSDPASMAPPVLSEIRKLASGLPVAEVRTMENFYKEGALFFNRLVTQLITAVGLMGLVLALIGLYGVIAYSVSRRTREIGIRMAIGADSGRVLRSVMLQGLVLAGLGIAIGMVAALGGSSVLKSFLVTVSAHDAAVFTFVPALLVAVSLAACYIPARRAARVDPLVALRQE